MSEHMQKKIHVVYGLKTYRASRPVSQCMRVAKILSRTCNNKRTIQDDDVRCGNGLELNSTLTAGYRSMGRANNHHNRQPLG